MTILVGAASYVGTVILLGVVGLGAPETIGVALVVGMVAAASVRGARDPASWIGAGLVIFLLGVVPSFALWLASGPGLAGGYHDAMIGVRNLSASEATLRWRWPGVLGAPILGLSGTNPIDPCEATGKSYPTGDHAITITSATMTRSFTFPVPSSHPGILHFWYLVGPDGKIEEVDEARYETAECSTGQP